MIDNFDSWLNESSTSNRLPKKAKEVWDKVLEILPELKKGKWTKHFDHDNIWVWSIPYNTVAGKWATATGIDDLSLSDLQIEYYSPDENNDNTEGFGIYDDNGNDVEIDGEERDILTYDPILISRLLNQKKAESWIVKNKEKGWVKITSKKFGI